MEIVEAHLFGQNRESSRSSSRSNYRRVHHIGISQLDMPGIVGPPGVCHSFLARHLGYSDILDCCAVSLFHVYNLFRAMAQARVDNPVGRAFLTLLSPDLLILDDLDLRHLISQVTAHLYQLIIGRHRAYSFVIPSNRTVREWLSTLDNFNFDTSALDKMDNTICLIVIKKTSHRE